MYEIFYYKDVVEFLNKNKAIKLKVSAMIFIQEENQCN